MMALFSDVTTPEHVDRLLEVEAVVDQLEKYRKAGKPMLQAAYKQQFANKSEKLGSQVADVLKDAGPIAQWSE